MNDANRKHPSKHLPPSARQHATAGPYSSVLEVDARRLVVLSGQVAVDMEGEVVGETIEEQTRVVIENCRFQLSHAGVTLSDVFKANVFLADLAMWEKFNAVYERLLPPPRPVRTAVQAVLLPGFLVEIEMWAVLPEGQRQWQR